MQSLLLKSILLVILSITFATFTNTQCLSDDDTLPTQGSTDLSGITDFGIELFKDIFPYTKSKNFFFSPYSIWNALALAYFGSEGRTMTQLQDVLRVSDKLTALKNWKTLQFMYYVRQLNNTVYTFNMANKIYFNTGIDLKPCIQDILKNETEHVDFSKPGLASSKINSMVAKATENKITELVLESDVINSQMAIINAAYFKGQWLQQFKKNNTKPSLFYMVPEDKKQIAFVDMMEQRGNFRAGISEELGAHVLELPYEGDAISMYILLPPFLAGKEGFNNMVKNLNASNLEKAIGQLWRGKVTVKLPKFKLDQSLDKELIASLENLGVRDLFSDGNLSGFTESRSLPIQKVIHKAFLEVSEEGTEAVAATALISFRVARPFHMDKFICNHPFLFIIYDNITNNILFIGAYKNPKA